MLRDRHGVRTTGRAGAELGRLEVDGQWCLEPAASLLAGVHVHPGDRDVQLGEQSGRFLAPPQLVTLGSAETTIARLLLA